MKNLKPIHLLLGGSLIIFLLTLLVVLIIDVQVVNFPRWVSFGLPFLTSIISFGVFYYFIDRFINERLKLLYRTIRKGKINAEDEPKFRITDDVIANAEKETEQWSEEHDKEISKLKEQEAFRREFLGNLAHELKTPVFSIQGYIETLLDGGLEDQKVNRKFLQSAANATNRMTSILEDLDQLTKLEVNALKLEMRPFDICELCKEVFESLELKANEKHFKLTFARDYNSVYVKGDRDKIAQVLSNVIVNSIFYGNEGGKVMVGFDEMDNIVSIEVSDNGPGIDSKDIPRLFERFYRVEKSRSRNEGGSGLGLAIVHSILESHGHNISVQSTIGVGSTFIFSLDKAEASSLYSSRGIQIK